MGQMKGKASIEFEHPPVIISAGSVVGKKEGEGPLGSLFDEVELDDMFGMDNWEQAESTMQKKTADLGQWRSTQDMRTRLCPWRPAILPLRKNSSVFRWPMGTSGRPLPHGL